MPLLQEELELEELEETPLRLYALDWEPGDRLFLTCLLPELTQTDLRVMATTSQYLAERTRHSKETQAATTPLPTYVAEFQSVFAKEDFDILPKHCKWDHAIELTPGAEPKSSKVYLLSPLEQTELDAFLEENLHTGVTPLENFLRKYSMGYALYPWISLLEFTLETSYKPQT